MQGTAFQIDKAPLLDMPILNSNNVEPIKKLVTKILEKKAQNSEINTEKLESDIDFIVYKMYNLTYEEACIIEGNSDWMSLEDYESFEIK